MSEIGLDWQRAVVSCAGFGTRLHKGNLEGGLLPHVGAPGFVEGWQAGSSASGGGQAKEIPPTFCVREMRVGWTTLDSLACFCFGFIFPQDPNRSSHKISVMWRTLVLPFNDQPGPWAARVQVYWVALEQVPFDHHWGNTLRELNNQCFVKNELLC